MPDLTLDDLAQLGGSTPGNMPAPNTPDLTATEPAIQQYAGALKDSGIPFTFTSGLRDQKHNAEVKGVPNSEHLPDAQGYSRAGDFVIPQAYVSKAQQVASMLGLDHLFHRGHVHVEIPKSTEMPPSSPKTSSLDSLLDQAGVPKATPRNTQNIQPYEEPYQGISGKGLLNKVNFLRSEAGQIAGSNSPGNVALRSLFPGAMVMGNPTEQTLSLAGSGSGLPPSSSLQKEGSPMLAAQEQSRQTAESKYPITTKVAGPMVKGFIPGTPENLTSILIAPLLQKSLQSGGKLLGNLFAKEPINSPVGEAIAGQMTPHITKVGVAKAAQGEVEIGLKMKNAALAAHPEIRAGMQDIVNNPKYIQMIDDYLRAGGREKTVAKSLYQKLADLSNNTNMTGPEMDRLRQTLWKAGQASKIGPFTSEATPIQKLNRMIANDVKMKMTALFGKDYEKALNKESLFLKVKESMLKPTQKINMNPFSMGARAYLAAKTGGLEELPRFAFSATPAAWALYHAGSAAPIGAKLGAGALLDMFNNGQ